MIRLIWLLYDPCTGQINPDAENDRTRRCVFAEEPIQCVGQVKPPGPGQFRPCAVMCQSSCITADPPYKTIKPKATNHSKL